MSVVGDSMRQSQVGMKGGGGGGGSRKCMIVYGSAPARCLELLFRIYTNTYSECVCVCVFTCSQKTTMCEYYNSAIAIANVVVD